VHFLINEKILPKNITEGRDAGKESFKLAIECDMRASRQCTSGQDIPKLCLNYDYHTMTNKV